MQPLFLCPRLYIILSLFIFFILYFYLLPRGSCRRADCMSSSLICSFVCTRVRVCVRGGSLDWVELVVVMVMVLCVYVYV